MHALEIGMALAMAMVHSHEQADLEQDSNDEPT
jgi:hypothetical protein